MLLFLNKIFDIKVNLNLLSTPNTSIEYYMECVRKLGTIKKKMLNRHKYIMNSVCTGLYFICADLVPSKTCRNNGLSLEKIL